MKKKLHIARSPIRFGLKGWEWAVGMKPRKSDRYWWAGDGLHELNTGDLMLSKFGRPMDYGSDVGYSGYIRRIKPSKKK
jgi:hypothetical protein